MIIFLDISALEFNSPMIKFQLILFLGNYVFLIFYLFFYPSNKLYFLFPCH